MPSWPSSCADCLTGVNHCQPRVVLHSCVAGPEIGRDPGGYVGSGAPLEEPLCGAQSCGRRPRRRIRSNERHAGSAVGFVAGQNAQDRDGIAIAVEAHPPAADA